MKQAHLLLVEDNEGDIYLTMEAMQKSTMIDKISVLKNGSDVMDFLQKKKKFTDAQTPDFIFLLILWTNIKSPIKYFSLKII